MRSDVSVIIPAYNSGISIVRCLESVFAQTANPKEIIVIDDGSIDNTKEAIASYGNKIIYSRQENSGPSSARNAGLRLATGTYIAFLDADDYWQPGFIAACSNFLDIYPNLVAVSTGQRFFTVGGKSIVSPKLPREECGRSFPGVLTDFFVFWAEFDHIRTGTCLIRRSAIEEAGLFLEDLRLGEDLEYWGYLATFGHWGFIPDPLWICDPWDQAARHGWMKRNAVRRKSCPDIEHWQRRIVGRIKQEDLQPFSVIRGRVAYSYAFSKIVSGDFCGARSIVADYGVDFPNNGYACIFRFLAGPAYRYMFLLRCFLLLKESFKALRLVMRRKNHVRH